MIHRNKLFCLRLKRIALHPFTVLTVATLATLAFVGLMAPLNRFAGEQRFFLIYYHAPIGFAFVVFLFDRLAHYRQISAWQWFVDFFVIVLALSRTIAPLPFFSGHALFLSYALLTISMRLTKAVMIAVLLDVAIVKIFWIRDLTLVGGLILGLAIGLIVRQFTYQSKVSQ